MRFEPMRSSLRLAAAYGVLHALVDAVTVTTVYAAAVRYRVPPETGILLILMYDVIAFASQPLFGWSADKLGRMRHTAGLGIGLCLCGALLLPVGPFVAAVTAGVGNALFHLGGGVVSMSIQPGRAAGPGVFVGPGTLGLAFGIWYGRFADAVPIPLLFALGASLIVPIFFPHPENMSAQNFPVLKDAPKNSAALAVSALMLLLVSILFRSLVGHSASHACPKITSVLFGLAAAGCLGKVTGGILSDKVGWTKTSVTALVAAGPLIAFGGDNPFLIGLGSGLFQMTMPVTLAAAASILPNRPALVFGLNCLAFIGGALPVFLGVLRPFYSPAVFLTVTVFAIAAVWVGLHLLKPRTIMRF